MADVTFAQIEAGMVDRLESQIPELVQCASYSGQIEDASNGLPIEAPACFVMFDGFDAGQTDDVLQHGGRARFSVLVVADSYVGGTQPRTGSQGAYELIDDVVTALDDHGLSLTGFMGLTLLGIDPVSVTKVRAMYRVRFDCLLLVTR